MEIQEINKRSVDEVLCGLSREITEEAISFLRGIKVKNSRWHKLFPDQEKSPWIRLSSNPSQYFLLYPKNYGPYEFTLDDLRKECFIVIGEVHEETCGKTFRDGDHFEVPPGSTYRPYTTDKICMVLIQTSVDSKPSLN